MIWSLWRGLTRNLFVCHSLLFVFCSSSAQFIELFSIINTLEPDVQISLTTFVTVMGMYHFAPSLYLT